MDYPRYPISNMHLGKFLDSLEFQSWKVNFKSEVRANSVLPEVIMQWIARWMGLPRQVHTGGGGPARVPNLRACEHLCTGGWHTQASGTIWSAWLGTSSRTH